MGTIQLSFQQPFLEEGHGLNWAYFPEENFPAGKVFFEERRELAFRENVVVVHNNWIVGHDKKKKRFQVNRLWDIGEYEVPLC